MRSREAGRRNGEELELEIDSLAQGGRGVARRGRLRRLRLRRPAGRPRAGQADARQARLRRGRAVELLSPSPERVAEPASTTASPARAPPGRAWPTSASSPRRPAQVDEALRRLGQPRRLRARADRAGAERVALPQQARVLASASGPASSRSAFTAAAAGRRSSTSTIASSPRRSTTRPATRSASGLAASGLPAYESRRQTGRAAQPRRPRGAAHRPGPDPAGHLPERDPAAARRPAHRDRGAGRRHRRPDRSARRGAPDARSSAACGSASPTPPSCRRTPRWPSGSTRSRRASPASTGSERLFDLYCGIGTIGLALAARAGEVWGIESVADAVADAEANAALNGIANARFVCADARLGIAAAARAGGAARRRRRRPAALGPLEEDRPPAARVRGAADRLRLLQPDDAGAQRGSDRRGGIYAAPREAGRHVPPDAARRVRGAARAR